MNIAEMRARQVEIEARLAEIHAESPESALTEERQTEWDNLETELAPLSENLTKAEARVARVATLAKNERSTEKPAERKAPEFHKTQTQQELYDLGELRAMSYSGEDFLSKVRDNAHRAIERAEYGVAGRKDVSKEDAQGHAEMLLDTVDNKANDLAKRFLLTGSEEYRNGFVKVMMHGSDAMCTNEERQALIRAQALGTDNAGGYAVPFQLDPTVILTNAGVTNPIRDLARVVQIVGKQWQGVTTAGVSVSRAAEGAEVGDNSFTLAQPTVSTNRVQGFVPFNIEIDLAWGALMSEITNVLSDAKAQEEDSFITGDGTGTNPQGIAAGLSGTVTAGGTASFAAADIYNLHAALDPRWESKASFLAHKAIYNKVRQFDTSGGAQLWAHIGDGRPNGLMGYSSTNASAMASTLTTGNKIMILGDFSNFLIVDRIGMTVELVPHLLGSNRRPTGQRGVYAVWMNNSKILVPGAFETLVTG
jgi:HK97 family phage major capsid protein